MGPRRGRNQPRPQAGAAWIHRLPVELIADIILLGLRGLKPKAATTYLANASIVCSIWRSITLSTPLLWTTIHFNLGDRIPHMRVRHRALQTVEIFLARSQDAPLDVELVFFSGNVHNQGSLDRLIPMLASHVHRFRSIWIDISDEGSARRLFPLRGPFPRLKHVRVDCSIVETRFGLVSNLPLELFPAESECVAGLRHLSLFGSKIISSTQTMPDVAFSDLQTVHIAGEATNWDSIVQLLQRSPRVMTLHMSIAPHSVPQNPAVSLPHLSHLTITDQALPRCASFSVPALTSITIVADHGHYIAASLPCQGAPCFPFLRSVTLRGTSIITVRLFLRANPQVTSLTLDHCERFNDLLILPFLMLLGAKDAFLLSWTPHHWERNDACAFERGDGALPALEEMIVVPSRPSMFEFMVRAQDNNAKLEWRAALQEELTRRRPRLRITFVQEGGEQ